MLAHSGDVNAGLVNWSDIQWLVVKLAVEGEADK